MTRQSFADGGVYTLDYDEKITTATEQNGKEVEYTFGTEGERTSIKYPDGKVAEYKYDGSLRLKTLIDGDNSVEYTYDTNSRLSDEAYLTWQGARANQSLTADEVLQYEIRWVMSTTCECCAVRHRIISRPPIK